MTTKAIFRKDAINKKGEASINIRITVDRKRSYLKTGIKIHKDQWDHKKGLVKRTNSNYRLLNHKLNDLMHKVQKLAFELEFNGKRYNAKLLKKVVEDKNPNCFIKFGKEWMQRRYKRNDISYIQIIRVAVGLPAHPALEIINMDN